MGNFHQWTWICFNLTPTDIISFFFNHSCSLRAVASVKQTNPGRQTCVSLYLPLELKWPWCVWDLSCHITRCHLFSGNVIVVWCWFTLIHSLFRLNQLKSQPRQTLFFVNTWFCRGLVGSPCSYDTLKWRIPLPYYLELYFLLMRRFMSGLTCANIVNVFSFLIFWGQQNWSFPHKFIRITGKSFLLSPYLEFLKSYSVLWSVSSFS